MLIAALAISVGRMACAAFELYARVLLIINGVRKLKLFSACRWINKYGLIRNWTERLFVRVFVDFFIKS